MNSLCTSVAVAACALFALDQLSSLFLPTDFGFLQSSPPRPRPGSRRARRLLLVHACLSVRLMKMPIFPNPHTGTQSPNHLRAQVLIPSAHSLFLISNEDIYADFSAVSPFNVKRNYVFFCPVCPNTATHPQVFPPSLTISLFLMKPLSSVCRYLVSINLMSLPTSKTHQLTPAFSRF